MNTARMWAGLTLAAAVVLGTLVLEAPVVIIKQEGWPLTITGTQEPFVALQDSSTWCVDGACWSATDAGLRLKFAAGSVYERIGLRKGDLLLRADESDISSVAHLILPGQQLRANGATCLLVQRDGERIEMGIVMSDATHRGGWGQAPISARPCDDLR